MHSTSNFNSDRLKQLNLNLVHAALLDWFAYFAHSGKQIILGTENDLHFYWVKYSKVFNDLLLPFDSNYKLNKCFDELCGIGNNEKAFPLIKKVFSSSGGNKVGIAIRGNVLEWLKGSEGAIMPCFSDELGLTAIKVNKKDYHKIPYNDHVFKLFKKLLKIKQNEAPLFTNHKLPDDKNHYSNLFANFQESMFALYEGKFLTKYNYKKLADWFITKYKYYLEEDKILFTIKQCKGDWNYISEIVINAAENYSLWFDINTEQFNKNTLPKDINSWIYSPHTETSMFYISLIKPPSSMRESNAEKVFDSVPAKIRKVFITIYKNDFDGFTFWNKINDLTKWYRKYAEKLINEDSNCYYWLGDGIINFMIDYKNWLLEFTDNKPFIKNIGINNSTFNLYLKQKIKDHDIQININGSI